ncbi:Di-sulfide bridge nucleocytoplasmic transport domain-containing protein [Fimicolochytrium jonesii]|uniref:Di-sulfide bridge nucleocytoplasmic transport domain-containing protein n=1 Tax=Fimicolochytrium jonesii TaxID=1396493 RepID=UPI0022FE6D2F|nr:Di-sulfide bridge nucleocytoplasmic transport domain-containing protein [Fimicolochytrium jonesii]KAI8824817.1 Di-sulfide bridge nucleocytoplasmic transport domain-containing protein [Fimicolochytrium jonesii]
MYYRSTSGPMDFRRTSEPIPWSVPLDSLGKSIAGGKPAKKEEEEDSVQAMDVVEQPVPPLDERTELQSKPMEDFQFGPISPFSSSGMAPATPKRRILQPRRRSPKGRPFYRELQRDESGSDEDVFVAWNSRKRLKKDDAEVSESSYSGHPQYTPTSEGFSSRTVLLPYMISGYIQMLFSTVIIGIMLYIIVQFVLTVQHDLDMKAEEYSLDIIHQVSECSKNYLENRCDPSTRVQYMQKACTDWEKCMQRDPKEVGRLKVGAETLAEILNKLVEPLSYKTMVFGTILLFGTLLLTSSALTLVKSRASSVPHMPAHPQPYSQVQHHPYPYIPPLATPPSKAWEARPSAFVYAPAAERRSPSPARRIAF